MGAPAAGGLDSRLGRITAVRDLANGAAIEYAYAGLARRVARTFGDGAFAQSFVGGSGYGGLDRFGRVLDLHFTDAGGRDGCS